MCVRVSSLHVRVFVRVCVQKIEYSTFETEYLFIVVGSYSSATFMLHLLRHIPPRRTHARTHAGDLIIVPR